MIVTQKSDVQFQAEGLFKRLGSRLDKHAPVIALVIAGLGFPFFGELAKSSLGYGSISRYVSIPACVIIVALYCFGVFYNNRRSSQVGNLEIENRHLRAKILQMDDDHREHCSRQLMTIAEQLNFRGSDRVSLYKYDSGKFLMLGRHAEQPELKAPGRGVYPADQGVIGMAWKSADGRCFVDDLPDPGDLEEYKKVNHEKFSFPPELIDSIVMRSRTIAAYVIKDHGGVGRAAVILFESVVPHRFADDELFAVSQGQHGRSMSLLLDVMKPHEPSIELAQSRGF